MTTKPFRFTVARYRILRAAAHHERGLVSRPYLTGFEAASWDRNAKALCDRGWLSPYVHGGYEITDDGRCAALGEMAAINEKDPPRLNGEGQ